MAPDLDELITHLHRTSCMTHAEAGRVIDDVMTFLDESVEQFVRRRHTELQVEGLANSAIFARIDEEISVRRFKAAALTPRQLRRIIYG